MRGTSGQVCVRPDKGRSPVFVDLDQVVFQERAWQARLLRALLDGANRGGPVSDSTLARTWQRLEALAQASRQERCTRVSRAASSAEFVR